MSARNEYSVFLDDVKRQRILRGLFDDFYADCTAEVIFDTNRAWCAWTPAIARLFPDAKVIACVRDLPWVIDSIERLIQRNVFSPSSIFNYTAGGTVYTRANGVAGRMAWSALPTMRSNRPATALNGIACAGPVRDPDHRPAKTHHAIYDFLDEPDFEHGLMMSIMTHQFDDRAKHFGTPHRAAHVKAEPPCELAAAGSVQSFYQRRLLARSAEDSRGSTDRMSFIPGRSIAALTVSFNAPPSATMRDILSKCLKRLPLSPPPKKPLSTNHGPLRLGPQPSRWFMFATLAIALVALVLAGLVYSQPPHTSGTGIPQQSGDARANVCVAYHAAHNAMVINTNLQSPNPKDPTDELSVATSARLALIGSGTYLKEMLAANSAAPTDLVNAVDALANTTEQLGINYLNRAKAGYGSVGVWVLKSAQRLDAPGVAARRRCFETAVSALAGRTC